MRYQTWIFLRWLGGLIGFWGLLVAAANGQPVAGTTADSATLDGATLDGARQLLQQNDVEGAIRVFLAAAEQAPELGDQATGFNNACVLLNRLGRYEEALLACERAIPLRRQQGDARRLARGLNNTALALQYLGRYDDAITLYHEALEINRQRADWQSVAINLSNLSLLESTVGRFQEAGDDAIAAIELAQEHAESDWAQEQLALARINYAVVLEKLGAFEEALEVYDQALAEAPELSPQWRVQVGANRGVLLRNLGDPLRAVSAFEQVLHLTEDRSAEANAWLNIGLVRYLNLGQPALAEKALRRGLELARESGDVAEELQGLYFLGRLLVDEGRLEEAEGVLQRCRQLAEASETPRGSWLAEELTARLARASGDLSGASIAFENALDWIETTRREWVPEVWRGSFAADQKEVFVAAVETALALADGDGEARLAWTWVQRAKERQLLDALGGTVGRPESLDGDVDVLDHLETGLGRGVLLEFFVGETRLHAWTLAQGHLRYHDLGMAAPILAAAGRVHGDLTASQAPTEDDLNLLSSALVASTGVLDTSSERLLIVADGVLHHLPFELLTKGGQPLVEDWTLHYLPSATLWRPLNRRLDGKDGDAELRLLAVGNPTLPQVGEEAGSVADLVRHRFDLPPLPAAEAEAQTAQRWLGGEGRLLLGFEASEHHLRQWAPKVGGVLHLGTHAVVDDGPGSSSAVVLTPDGFDDGLLLPHEIAELSLRAPLTVLASCRSGLDRGQGSDALATLSGAFLAAGSSAVVVSLWSVEDQATGVFMEQFYYQLSRGNDPAQALRLAKQRLRQDPRWDRPWIWSAFVLIGDGPPLVQPWTGRGIFVLAGGLLVVLMTWIWWRRRQQNA